MCVLKVPQAQSIPMKQLLYPASPTMYCSPTVMGERESPGLSMSVGGPYFVGWSPQSLTIFLDGMGPRQGLGVEK